MKARKKGVLRPRTLLILLAVFIGFQYGCAIKPTHYTAEETEAVGAVGVVSATFIPEGLLPPEHGVAESAASGAAAAGSVGLIAAIPACMATGPLAPILCSAYLTAAGYMATGGAVIGGLSHTGRAKIEKIQDHLQEITKGEMLVLQTQRVLHTEVKNYAREVALHNLKALSQSGPTTQDAQPDYSALANQGIDAVLEVSLLKIAMTGGWGVDPAFVLDMTARARLVRVSDASVLVEKKYHYFSSPLSVTDWMKQDAAYVGGVLKRGYQYLAENIIDDIFLLYEPPSWRYQNREPKVEQQKPSEAKEEGLSTYIPAIGPRVFSPRPQHCSLMHFNKCRSGEKTFSGLMFNETLSLSPLLRWEHFPRSEDWAFDYDRELPRISNVTYELRLYEGEFYPGTFSRWAPSSRILYVRDLRTPSYQLKKPLKACTHFIWTVRARFNLDDRPRVTEWSGDYPGSSRINPKWMRQMDLKQSTTGGIRGLKYFTRFDFLSVTPSSYYYPFKTPCARADINTETKKEEKNESEDPVTEFLKNIFNEIKAMGKDDSERSK